MDLINFIQKLIYQLNHKFYPKAYLPVKPNVEHPPPFEPLKVIQPVDPFHNAFFYTNDQQNNILSQQYKPEVVIPMMYRRRHKHEFEPISPIPGDAPPTNVYGSRFNHPDNTLTSDFVAQPSIEQKPALLPFFQLNKNLHYYHSR